MRKLFYILGTISIMGLLFIAFSVKDKKRPTYNSPHLKPFMVNNLTSDGRELNVFKSVHPKMIEEIKKIPACLEDASNKNEAFTCSQGLRQLSQKLALVMGNHEEIRVEGYGKDFIWNDETKRSMITELERSQESMKETQTCIDKADTSDELEACLK